MQPMTQWKRWFRRSRGVVALALGALLAGAASAAPDPVENLQKALAIGRDRAANISDGLLRFREDSIKGRIDAIKGIGDLRKALVLADWRDAPDLGLNEKLRLVDLRMRQLVGERLVKAMRSVADKGEPNAKLAVGNMIAEMGPSIPSLDVDDRFGFARTLAPIVITLAKDKNLAVRQQALRALSNINAKPSEVVPVLMETLAKDELEPRRVAADGLVHLVRVVNHLHKPGQITARVRADRKDVLEVLQEVVVGSTAGIRDADPEVRALSLEVIHESARTLKDMIPDQFDKRDLPPGDKELSEEEIRAVQMAQDGLLADLRDIEGILKGMKAQAPLVAKLLQDPQAPVRLAAIQTLEQISLARFKTRRRVQSVPTLSGQGDRGVAEAFRKADPIANFLGKDQALVAQLLRDSDERMRRAAIDFLELLEEGALPSLPEIIDCMASNDKFLRLAAARAIGNIAPEKSLAAVPALAKLVGDIDVGVKQAAMSTLEIMGPLAKDAVPALTQAVAVGDAENRVAALYALMQIGKEHVADSIATIAGTLTNADPRVRRAAALALGRFGAVSQPAVPALRRALGDDDQEVRINASDALLSIIPLPPSQ